MRAVLSLVLPLLLVATAASGETTEEQRNLAESLFQNAKALMKEGKYAEACPKLAESFRLDGVGGTMINWADCEEHLGKWATALTYFDGTAPVPV